MNVRHLQISGKTVLVDEEDFPRVSTIAWRDNGLGYISGRWTRAAGGDGGFVYLHRFITGAPAGMVVDHIDGNPLNNTRDNLQVTTNSRNAMRSQVRRGGVTKLHNSDRWRVRLRVDGRQVSLGCFDTRAEADAALEIARGVIWHDPTINTLGTVL